jgi:hypothetical protein
MGGIMVKGVKGSIREPIILKETAAGCWECISHACDQDGYPIFRWGHHRSMMYFFFERYNGHPVAEGMCICHRCDNRKCVNPAHLFLGTSQENTADRHAKNRSARGERIGSSILREEEAREILNSKEPGAVLARRFGVSSATVSAIRKGRNWKWLKEEQ